jgi:hypothetical protein
VEGRFTFMFFNCIGNRKMLLPSCFYATRSVSNIHRIAIFADKINSMHGFISYEICAIPLGVSAPQGSFIYIIWYLRRRAADPEESAALPASPSLKGRFLSFNIPTS